MDNSPLLNLIFLYIIPFNFHIYHLFSHIYVSLKEVIHLFGNKTNIKVYVRIIFFLQEKIFSSYLTRLLSQEDNPCKITPKYILLTGNKITTIIIYLKMEQNHYSWVLNTNLTALDKEFGTICNPAALSPRLTLPNVFVFLNSVQS